jgi:hypothetical protein
MRVAVARGTDSYAGYEVEVAVSVRVPQPSALTTHKAHRSRAINGHYVAMEQLAVSLVAHIGTPP